MFSKYDYEKYLKIPTFNDLATQAIEKIKRSNLLGTPSNSNMYVKD